MVNTEKGLMEVQRMSCAGMKLSCQLKVQNSLWTATEVNAPRRALIHPGRSPCRVFGRGAEGGEEVRDLAKRNTGCPGTWVYQITPARTCETPRAVPAALRRSSRAVCPQRHRPALSLRVTWTQSREVSDAGSPRKENSIRLVKSLGFSEHCRVSPANPPLSPEGILPSHQGSQPKALGAVF